MTAVSGDKIIGIRPSDFDTARAALVRAPFEEGAWMLALNATARATGSQTAVLSGMNLASGGLAVYLMPDKPENIERDYLACGGTDPDRNLLLHHARLTPVMRSITDVEAIDRDTRRRDPTWNEFYVKYGFAHSCICPLWRRGKTGLAVNLRRSTKEGPIAEGERRVFLELTKYWRNAVTLDHTLKSQVANLLAGTLDALSVAAIAVDSFRRVMAMTRLADEMVRTGELLRLEGGELIASVPGYRGSVELAVGRGVGTWPNPGRPSELELHGARGRAARIRISPLPHDNRIGFGAAAIVIVEGASARTSNLDDLGLTAAESAVAEAVLAGQSIRVIARQRAVAYETVRSQIKVIYGKAGVASRGEFMAKLPCRRSDR